MTESRILTDQEIKNALPKKLNEDLPIIFAPLWLMEAQDTKTAAAKDAEFAGKLKAIVVKLETYAAGWTSQSRKVTMLEILDWQSLRADILAGKIKE